MNLLCMALHVYFIFLGYMYIVRLSLHVQLHARRYTLTTTVDSPDLTLKSHASTKLMYIVSQKYQVMVYCCSQYSITVYGTYSTIDEGLKLSDSQLIHQGDHEISIKSRVQKATDHKCATTCIQSVQIYQDYFKQFTIMTILVALQYLNIKKLDGIDSNITVSQYITQV